MIDEEMNYLNDREKKIIGFFVKELKELKEKLGDNIVSIRLFGSKARGDFREGSDIDIFILVKKKTLKVRDVITEIEVNYDIDYNLPISTVLYSLFEYKKNKELGSFFLKMWKKKEFLYEKRFS